MDQHGILPKCPLRCPHGPDDVIRLEVLVDVSRSAGPAQRLQRLCIPLRLGLNCLPQKV